MRPLRMRAKRQLCDLDIDPIEIRDLDTRAQAFVDLDKGIANSAEVLLGVGHLIAEQFGEHADLRGRLRRILWRSGKLVTTRVPPP